MKHVLLSLYVVMLLLTGVAILWTPAPDADRLVWATDANPVRIEQMRLFRDAHPEHGIMIDPDNTGKQKIITQSLAGMGPDVFDNSGYDLADFVVAGIAMDLTPIVELARLGLGDADAWDREPYLRHLVSRTTEGWRREHGGASPGQADLAAIRATAAERLVRVGRALDWQRLWPIGQKQVLVDGRQYAFPCNLWWCMVAYHQDLFEQAGVPAPAPDWTWDQFLDVAQRLTVRDPQTGRAKQFGVLSLDPYEIACSWGAEFLNETGTACVFDGPAAVRGYRFFFDLRDRYRVLPTPAEMTEMAGQGGWGTGAINLFGAKHAAMMRFGRYGLINWRLMNQEAVRRGDAPPLRIGFAPLPMGVRHYACGGSRICVVNARSPRRFDALDFLEYLAGPAYGKQINWSADCIPGPVEWTQTREQISNPETPDEHAFDLYWREQAANVYEYPRSDFISNYELGDIRGYYTDLMSSGQVSVEEGIRRMCEDVNRRILRTVREDRRLRGQYERACERQAAIDAAARG